MPSASNDDDIVFAVYMPPHEPTLGQALRSMPSKSSFDILPAVYAPTASNARHDRERLGPSSGPA